MQSSSSSTSLSFSGFLPKESRHLYCVPITVLACLLLFLLTFSSPHLRSSSASDTGAGVPASLISSSLPPPPSFAYLLSGSTGDGDRLLRLLRAIYHPKNLYLLHLHLSAPQEQRGRLARAVRIVPLFRSARNVHVVGRADFANRRGSSALAATLHGAAVLLRISPNWDWFVNLSADEYPLVTQDDLLHVFSFLPKDLNFMQHSSYIGWRDSRRLKNIIIDPSLYEASKADIFYATQKRDLPNAYRVFTGSSSVILSRKFTEYMITGTDNLPRSLLMYFANTPSSHTNYLQTVLCNSPKFNKTIVNNHLRYMTWNSTSKPVPILLDLMNMTTSGAVFGKRFLKDDPVLDEIDQKLLNRSREMVVPGGWCLGKGEGTDPCGVLGNPDALLPGPGATRLARNLVELLSNESFHSHQCT